MTINPLESFIQRYGVFVVDGGLATQLEARGADLSDALWSARLLKDDPALIAQVHADYLWAGADCIISASYQATIPGFVCAGLDERAARRLIDLSVELAVEERDKYWANLPEKERAGRIKPLVAASVGPYAAYRADGSEYSGQYDLDEEGLLAFHRERWKILADTQADILACETIPVFAEARALARLLVDRSESRAWFAFTCRDAQHIVDGTPIRECAAFLDSFDQAAAIGVNCTPPRFVPELIQEIRKVSRKPVIVYPNSGESYDAAHHTWRGESVPAEFGTFSREWRKLGAAAIGGCCRTTPAHIRQIRDRFPWQRREDRGYVSNQT